MSLPVLVIRPDFLICVQALYLQALQIRRELFGTNHVDVAASLSNLALLHEAMGSFNEALVLHEQALAIRVSCLGPEHELVAETLVNIGLLHKRDRNIEDARAMFERAIEIYNLMPGMVGLGGSLAMHPDLAAAQAHLVALNEAIDDQTADVDTDDGTGAKGAITIVSGTRRFAGVTPSKLYVRVHRAEHEKLALSLRSMALALQSRGEADGARPFLEQSLGLLLAVSSGRPDASELCTDGIVLLALLYRDLGRNVLCHDLLSRALVSYTAMFKTNQCPKVVDTMRELGKTSNLQQEFSGSKQMLSDALRIAKDLFSVSCVEVSSIILEQGISARDTNELERSKELFEECLQMRISSLGDGHPLVAGALVELGQVYRLKGSFTRARYLKQLCFSFIQLMSIYHAGNAMKSLLRSILMYPKRKTAGATRKSLLFIGESVIPVMMPTSIG